MSDPNFPTNLAIAPSTAPDDRSDAFSSSGQLASIKKYGIAGRVWEASYPMLLYLASSTAVSEFDPPFAANPEHPLTILELGAGTGIVTARMLALMGPDDIIVCTDLPDVCPLLHANVNAPQNAPPPRHPARVRSLAWGDAAHAAAIAAELGLAGSTDPSPNRTAARGPRYLTHILCSDLVYFPDLLAPLLRTLIHLTSPPFAIATPDSDDSQVDINVVISYKIRSLAKEAAFWAAFGLWFAFEPVMTRAAPNSNSDSNTDSSTDWRRLGVSTDAFVFVARRRPESRGWAVPAGDGALLAGVGAWGSETGRCDDTFETLLLMGLDGDGDEDDEEGGARSASAA